jgi:hypothetical protein
MVSEWPDGFPARGDFGTTRLSRSDFAAGDKLEPIYLRETNFVKAPPSRRIRDLILKVFCSR